MRDISRNKKGFAYLQIVMYLGLGVVSIVVIALLLQKMNSTSLSCSDTTNFGWNESIGQCQNLTGANMGTRTFAGNISINSLDFVRNAAYQLPTAGTITGVTLLLAIIALVGFGGYTAYKRTR